MASEGWKKSPDTSDQSSWFRFITVSAKTAMEINIKFHCMLINVYCVETCRKEAPWYSSKDTVRTIYVWIP